MLTLWCAPGTIALAPHIALEEAGADFGLRWVNFADAEQTKDGYLAVNPKGRVPTLETPDGTLNETIALLDYIAAVHPDARLAPTEPFARARALSFQAYLAATVHVAHAHKMRGARWSDDPSAWETMKAKVTRNMTDCMALIEAHHFTGPWVLGEQWTTCDAYLYTIWRWLPGDGVDTTAFPRLQAHADAMEARPAVARALAASP